jgi:hypothetical protein
MFTIQIRLEGQTLVVAQLATAKKFVLYQLQHSPDRTGLKEG